MRRAAYDGCCGGVAAVVEDDARCPLRAEEDAINGSEDGRNVRTEDGNDDDVESSNSAR